MSKAALHNFSTVTVAHHIQIDARKCRNAELGMNQTARIQLLIATIGTLATSAALAHSGGTNSAGCHNDHKNGGYHCHTSSTPVTASPTGAVIKPPTPEDTCMIATVDRVIDGDTVSLRTEQGLERVRINQIDAPERSQPFGVQATACLTQILGTGFVRMCSDGKDKYGRTVASISAQGQNVSTAMVLEGCAWAYTKYLESDSSLPSLEAAAQAAGRGVWANGNAQAPWQYRAGVGPVTATNGQTVVDISTPTTAAVHERVFDWVEHKFPEHTADGTATTSNGGFYGRCYTSSGLCVRYQNGRFSIVDQAGNAADAGSANDLIPTAASEGF